MGNSSVINAGCILAAVTIAFCFMLSSFWWGSCAQSTCDTHIEALVIGVTQGVRLSDCRLDLLFDWQSQNLTSWVIDVCPFRFREPYQWAVCIREESPLEIHRGNSSFSSVKERRASFWLTFSLFWLIWVFLALGVLLPYLRAKTWPKLAFGRRYFKWSGETELSANPTTTI